MIKRTLFFVNPLYLSTQNERLSITEKNTGEITNLPFEDIGYIICDNKQIVFTQSVIQKCSQHNICIIFCDDSHLPNSMLLHLVTNNVQSQLFAKQISAKENFKKVLWQTTINAKINNQASLLKKYEIENATLLKLRDSIKKGDETNREAVASKYYWKNLFPKENIEKFKRDRYGDTPNNFFNYGYAILRAAIAKGLSGSGLLPTLGIHHKNKYNHFCLADDIMEPYRPFVDELVLVWLLQNKNELLDIEFKKHILTLLTADVKLNDNIKPLSIAISSTTSSLAKSFNESKCLIQYPELI